MTAHATGLVITVDDDTPIRLRQRRLARLTRTAFLEGIAGAGPATAFAGDAPNTDGDNDETTVTGTIAGVASSSLVRTSR